MMITFVLWTKQEPHPMYGTIHMLGTAPPTDPSSDRSGLSYGAVGIVASAGGINACLELLSGLPAEFRLPIVLMQHLPRGAVSVLPQILVRKTPLRCRWIEKDEALQAGTVHICPPGHGVTVSDGGLHLFPLPPNSSSWLTAADLMLSSLAAAYGREAIGIVLSGSLTGGAEGIRSIRLRHGMTMAQCRKSSHCFDMPGAAADLGKAEVILPPYRLAMALLVATQSAEENAGDSSAAAVPGQGSHG